VIELENGDLAMGLHGGEIKIWNAKNGDLLETLHDAYPYFRFHMVLLGYGNIACGYQTGVIHIRNLTKKSILKSLYGHMSEIKGLVLLSNDNLASYSEDGILNVWNVTSGHIVNTLKQVAFNHMIALPNASLAAIISNSKRSYMKSGLEIIAWNSETNEIVKICHNFGDFCEPVELLLLNQSHLASYHYGDTIRIWNFVSGQFVKKISTDERMGSLLKNNSKFFATFSTYKKKSQSIKL
jgi:WD40 repeat protein